LRPRPYSVLALFLMRSILAVSSGCASSTTAPLGVLLVTDRNPSESAEFAARLERRGEIRIGTTCTDNGLRVADADVLLVDWSAAAKPSEADRRLVQTFIRPGKGIVAIGGTLAAVRSCPAIADALGGSADGGALTGELPLVVLDPADATMTSLGGRFTLVDSPVVVDRCDGGNDLLIRTAVPLPLAVGKPADKPVPVAWTRRAGAARVFAAALGVEGQALQNEELITLIHNALRWAGGRVPDTQHNVLSRSEEQVGFELLFNGRDLSGWKGTPGLWSVENGEIVGRGANLPHNVFLTHEKEYGDFLLRFSVKLINHNSGVQVRSREFPEFVVKGYQADVADKWYGSLYEEGLGRGVLADGFRDKGEKVVRLDGWNDMTVKAVGPRITITLNGLQTVEFTETDTSRRAKGIIALQLHKGPPMEVRFRDIRIRPLNE
jgi:type 1 glutamine amidotransferase